MSCPFLLPKIRFEKIFKKILTMFCVSSIICIRRSNTKDTKMILGPMHIGIISMIPMVILTVIISVKTGRSDKA